MSAPLWGDGRGGGPGGGGLGPKTLLNAEEGICAEAPFSSCGTQPGRGPPRGFLGMYMQGLGTMNPTLSRLPGESQGVAFTVSWRINLLFRALKKPKQARMKARSPRLQAQDAGRWRQGLLERLASPGQPGGPGRVRWQGVYWCVRAVCVLAARWRCGRGSPRERNTQASQCSQGRLCVPPGLAGAARPVGRSHGASTPHLRRR